MSAPQWMKNLKLFGPLALLATALAFGFSNCSRSDVQFSETLQKNFSSQGTGNGTNYDGKPEEGTYYRLAPNQRCGTRFQLVGKIEVRADSIVAELGNPDDCTKSTSTLDPSKIESSAYDREVIGFGDGIYKKYETPPDLNQINLQLAEAWCRIPSSSGSVGVDIVTLADVTANQVNSAIFIGESSASGASTKRKIDVPGPLVRKATLSQVDYSGSNFKMSLTPALNMGGRKWQGRINAKIDNDVIDSPVECRIGGHLDYEASPRPLTCPLGYIELPALNGYTISSVCIAKYEAKQVGAQAAIQPQGLPWMNINRNDARAACQAMGAGFDLTSNNEWQALARNIEAQSANWSSGIVGTGDLNEGQTNNNPATALEAPADDQNPCYGVNQTCSLSTWNQKRRIHFLSTGTIIWDVGGNAYEWTRDDNNQAYGPDGHMQAVTNAVPYAAGAKDKFGPAGDYLARTSQPWSGIGYGYLNHSDGTIVRGAGFDENKGAGIFQTSLWFSPTQTWPSIGFRCVYYP